MNKENLPVTFYYTFNRTINIYLTRNIVSILFHFGILFTFLKWILFVLHLEFVKSFSNYKKIVAAGIILPKRVY